MTDIKEMEEGEMILVNSSLVGLETGKKRKVTIDEKQYSKGYLVAIVTTEVEVGE